MQRFPVQVAGVDLEAERYGLFPRTRLLQDGEEVPRDRWENYVLKDAEGREHRPEVGYDSLNMSPVVYDPTQPKPIVAAPLPRPVVVIFLVTLALGLVGGFLGVLVVSLTQRLSVRLLRSHWHRSLAIGLVALLWVALTVVWVWQAQRILNWF